MSDGSKSNFRKKKKIDFLRADLIDYRKISWKSTSLDVLMNTIRTLIVDDSSLTQCEIAAHWGIANGAVQKVCRNRLIVFHNPVGVNFSAFAGMAPSGVGHSCNCFATWVTSSQYSILHTCDVKRLQVFLHGRGDSDHQCRNLLSTLCTIIFINFASLTEEVIRLDGEGVNFYQRISF